MEEEDNESILLDKDFKGSTNMFSYAVGTALKLQSLGQISVVDAQKQTPEADQSIIPSTFTMPALFSPGWACQPK